jgi:Bacterial archaeo-eukaryotic release factor family 10
LPADPIADLRSPAGSLISVYVDRPLPGGMAALLSDLLKPVRQAAQSRDRSVQKSVKADADRIHGYAEQLESDGAPSYAIFASEMDDVFTLEGLAHEVTSLSSLGPRPYLRPLRAAPRLLRAGVIVADRAQSRVFVASGDLVEEVGAPFIADIGKSNFGGFSGYEEQGVRARADEASSRMWKEAGSALLDRHLERPFDYVAIGGHLEMVDEIGRTLHPYLGSLYRGTFIASPHTVTLAGLRAELGDMATEVRRSRQSDLATRVCDTALAGGLAVTGLVPTLAYCNAQAVETLLVAGEFRRPGVFCDSCGHLSRAGTVCPVCSSATFVIDDVVAAAMESVVAAGGSVHQIEVASPLDEPGIGALTRFPIPR